MMVQTEVVATTYEKSLNKIIMIYAIKTPVPYGNLLHQKNSYLQSIYNIIVEIATYSTLEKWRFYE